MKTSEISVDEGEVLMGNYVKIEWDLGIINQSFINIFCSIFFCHFSGNFAISCSKKCSKPVAIT